MAKNTARDLSQRNGLLELDFNFPAVNGIVTNRFQHEDFTALHDLLKTRIAKIKVIKHHKNLVLALLSLQITESRTLSNSSTDQTLFFTYSQSSTT